MFNVLVEMSSPTLYVRENGKAKDALDAAIGKNEERVWWELAVRTSKCSENGIRKDQVPILD
jgi:hypothetical protein